MTPLWVTWARGYAASWEAMSPDNAASFRFSLWAITQSEGHEPQERRTARLALNLIEAQESFDSDLERAA